MHKSAGHKSLVFRVKGLGPRKPQKGNPKDPHKILCGVGMGLGV